MQKMHALNVYQINIFLIIRFMHKHKLNKNPKISANSFNKIEHKYPTRYSRNNYKLPKLKTKNKSFAINYWGPYLWNKCPDDNEKVILSMNFFSSIIKKELRTMSKSLCPSSPALSWDAMYIFFEEDMRGGVSYISGRYSKANNKYLKSCDPKQKLKHNI